MGRAGERLVTIAPAGDVCRVDREWQPQHRRHGGQQLPALCTPRHPLTLRSAEDSPGTMQTPASYTLLGTALTLGSLAVVGLGGTSGWYLWETAFHDRTQPFVAVRTYTR